MHLTVHDVCDSNLCLLKVYTCLDQSPGVMLAGQRSLHTIVIPTTICHYVSFYMLCGPLCGHLMLYPSLLYLLTYSRYQY